jgi:copper transport protein
MTMPSQRGRIPLLIGVLFALMTAAGLVISPARVDAHAFLERSDPEANAVLPEQATEVRLWFTEPLEADSSRADLYDAAGQPVSQGDSRIGDEPNQLILPLPPDLPNGTYTVQWRNVSTVDGHPQQGYLPFTIGSQADVVTPITPELTAFTSAPTWLDAMGRWLSLLGVTGAVGALACWLFVLRPTSERLDDNTADHVRSRALNLVLLGALVSLIGSLIALVVQAYNAGDGLAFSAVTDTLLDTRFGHLWIARIILLAGVVAIATTDVLWDDEPPVWMVALALAVGGAAFLPYSLNAHGAALEVGRAAAIAADWLHIAATSVWIGGVITLLVALVYGLRGSASPERRAVYAGAISRFTTLALVSVVVLALTGVYAAWVHVGNLTALRETDYGRALVIKLLLMVPLLVLGALNMRIFGPRMEHAARSGAHFGRAIAAEALLGVGILFAVGLLTTFPTGREVVTSEAESTTYHIFNEDSHIVLYLSPGSAGVNRYTVDVNTDPTTISDDTQLLLRFSREDDNIEGVREVQLAHSFGQRFEGEGSELSVVGDWDLEAIYRQAGQADVRFEESLSIPRTPPAERVPGPAPVFPGWSAAVAMLFIGVAVAVVVAFVRAPGHWRDRAVEVGSGVALLVAGIAILAITREEAVSSALAANPIPPTSESVAAGRVVFEENCVACHGDQGLGDGSQGVNLNPPPANLTEPHVGAHTDADLYWWIENGISPNMPGFGEELTEEEIWNAINYVRSLREGQAAQ